MGPKQTMGKIVECVGVTIHMPKVVLSANLTATQGTYTYDPVTKVKHSFSCSEVIIQTEMQYFYVVLLRTFFKKSGLKNYYISSVVFYLHYNLAMANFPQT